MYIYIYIYISIPIISRILRRVRAAQQHVSVLTDRDINMATFKAPCAPK